MAAVVFGRIERSNRNRINNKRESRERRKKGNQPRGKYPPKNSYLPPASRDPLLSGVEISPLPLLDWLIDLLPLIDRRFTLSPRSPPSPLRQTNDWAREIEIKGQRDVTSAPKTNRAPLADTDEIKMTSSRILFCQFILLNDRVLKYRFQRDKKSVCVAMSGKKIWRCFFSLAFFLPELRSSNELERDSTRTEKQFLHRWQVPPYM